MRLGPRPTFGRSIQVALDRRCWTRLVGLTQREKALPHPRHYHRWLCVSHDQQVRWRWWYKNGVFVFLGWPWVREAKRME